MKTNNPHAITTNNTTPQTSLAPIDPKGLQLRQTAEHLALERLIEQLRNDELDTDTLCKILHNYCELKKQDVAAEKNRVALQIAQQPKRTRISTTNHAGSRILSHAAMIIPSYQAAWVSATSYPSCLRRRTRRLVRTSFA